MKKILLIALLVAAVSCKGKKSENASVADMKWEKIEVEDLQMRPVAAFDKDWMALAVGNSSRFNAMTISWGTIGELWNKPVVIVYVSSDRATKKLMDENKYFTVSAFPSSAKESLVYIGSHSMKDEPDKVAAAGLTAEFSPLGNPMFKEACLTIECRKIYAEPFKEELLPDDVRPRYEKMGMHTAYIGEIVNVWEKE